MELTKIEEALKKNNLKLDFMNKGIFTFVSSKLENTENLNYVTLGLTGTYKTAIIVTDEHLYIAKATGMLSGIDFNTIPRKTITSIKVESGLLFSTLNITVGSMVHKLEKVISAHASELNKILLIKPEEQKQSIPQNPTDEIRKYKSLLDDGIISQEEFDKKKKELLGL
jgi:hypothetical protein